MNNNGYAVLSFFLLIFLLFNAANDNFFTSTDFGAWGDDSLYLIDCLKGDAQSCSNISHLPVAYVINSFFINVFKQVVGISGEAFLLIINSIFLILPILFLLIVRGKIYFFKVFFLYVLAIILTPLPEFYLYSGALEFQSGVVLGIFLSSIALLIHGDCKSQKIVKFFLIISLLMLPLYKDTLIPIAILSIILALVLTGYNFKPFLDFRVALNFISKTFYFLIPLVISILLIISYNFIKYNSVFPENYVLVAEQTSPSLLKSVEFLVASIFSPNGGFLIFWGSSFLTCIFFIQKFGLSLNRFSIFLSLGVIFINLLGLSMWYVPFGWDSWGNRLMIPSGLATLIVLITTSNYSKKTGFLFPTLAKIKSSYFKRGIKVMLIVLFTLSFLYISLGYLLDNNRIYYDSLRGSGTACDLMVEKLTEWSKHNSFWRTDYYYDCAKARFLHFPIKSIFE